MTTPPPASAPSSSSGGVLNDSDEAELRSQLRKSLKSLQQREPLDHTYKHLLFDSVVTSRRPTLPKDKMYKNIGANLRETVTNFADNPWDKIARREPMEDDKMRAAFTLRENKKHEQEALLAATLAARQPSDFTSKKRKLEGMAMTLQRKRPKKKPKAVSPAQAAANKAEEEARRLQAERERQMKQVEQRKKREAAHLRRLEEERREEEERIARMQESPQEKLARFINPVFQKLWDMEFPLLQNTNPFRIVIDKNNCAAMGAPDYMDVIKQPMNLTYISDKIKNAKYDTLKEFFSDVDLMVSNALLYNSDPNNAYHVAAKEMRKVFKREGSKLYQDLQKLAKR